MSVAKKRPVVTCARCGIPFEQINTRQKFCRPCAPAAERERAKVHAAEIAPQKKAYMSAWRAENAEAVAVYSRDYTRSLYTRHIGDLVPCPDCGRNFVLNAPRRVRCEACSAIHRTNRSVTKAAKWNSKNKERRQARLTERYHSDAATKLNTLMASGIGDSLRGTKGRRKWQDLVGYSVSDLIAHIESQFAVGMSWANHTPDGWHVDHKRPKASFSFKTADDPEFLECWGLPNLQPLWAPENLRKNAKWTPPASANDNGINAWRVSTS